MVRNQRPYLDFTHDPSITLIPKIQVKEDVAVTLIPVHTDSSCSKHAMLHTV